MPPEDALIGKPITIAIDGQDHQGLVTAVHPNRLEVTLNVNQRATDYTGQEACVKLPDGREVTLDLGVEGHFTRLVVSVPLPRPAAAEAPAASGSERRRFFRFAVTLPVEIMEPLAGHGDYVWARARTINLSGGGMLLRASRALAGEIRFRLHLPTETLLLRGRVVRMGGGDPLTSPVEFVGLTEQERTKIIRFIFMKMRNLVDRLEHQKETEDLPRHRQRRERFFKPAKIRYW